ncbi:MAG: leucine-rich repeat domain-containing protein, partial [Treponema sp.]|nr:leucine-rich repeat domain-containing protein [Treponema sp.]
MKKGKVFLIVIILLMASGAIYYFYGISKTIKPVTLEGPIATAEEIRTYLVSHAENGNSPDDPLALPVALAEGLGVMTDEDSGWQKILSAIEASQKYVELDLSECEMSTDRIFDPDNSISTGKNKIVSIVLPDDAVRIRENPNSGTFRFFYNLKKASAQNIAHIGDRSFYDLENLSLIDFPKASLIGAYAFSNCKNLANANFPSASMIEKSAFAGAGFTSADFPLARSIGEEAFNSCGKLVEVIFPSAEYIGKRAFNSCDNLIVASLPKAQNIMENAFSNCVKLTEAGFPASARIGEGVFSNCPLLAAFVLSGEGNLIVMEDGKMLARNTNEGIELVSYPSAHGEIALNDITSIGSFAFAGNLSLESIVSSSVTNIKEYAFQLCENLKSVNFSAVTIINANAFESCKNLASVNFRAATNIGRDAFKNCISLTSAVFQAATSIDEHAFLNCVKLSSVTLPQIKYIGDEAFASEQREEAGTALTITMGASAPSLGTGIFSELSRTIIVQVPRNATGYGNIPAVYDNTDDTSQNWGNGLRGKGWDGFTGGYNIGAVNTGITVN